MLNGTLFLGKEIDYWMELEKTAPLSHRELIEENAKLRAKASYFDAELIKMKAFAKAVDYIGGES